MTHLKSRSEAIRSAIRTYNKAADNANPKRDRLDPDEVLQYSYIGQFDVLRDTRNAITEKPWAVPTNRIARDAWFKSERAKEELVRAEVEVARLYSWMQKEENMFSEAIDRTASEKPTLSKELRLRLRRLRETHKLIHHDLSRLQGIVDYTPSFILNPPTDTITRSASQEETETDSDPEDGDEAAQTMLDNFLDGMANLDNLG